MRNLPLPPGPLLAVNLRRDREAARALQQRRADDDPVVAQHRLVVVQVRGARWAVAAVDGVACFSFSPHVRPSVVGGPHTRGGGGGWCRKRGGGGFEKKRPPKNPPESP